MTRPSVICRFYYTAARGSRRASTRTARPLFLSASHREGQVSVPRTKQASAAGIGDGRSPADEVFSTHNCKSAS